MGGKDSKNNSKTISKVELGLLPRAGGVFALLSPCCRRSCTGPKPFDKSWHKICIAAGRKMTPAVISIAWPKLTTWRIFGIEFEKFLRNLRINVVSCLRESMER